ncbi:MAG: hypothetical protein GPJ50_13865, partial [Candidatus Heimdallarchaeota archaeon]|nr:hypothetical protein [Candidatus Heimdallarchaeota archaeon]
MWFLVVCPNCKKLHIYNKKTNTDSSKRIRKDCCYCHKRFRVNSPLQHNIVKQFDSHSDCHQAHKILSQHHNDQLPTGSLENILINYQNCLLEHLKSTQTNLEKEGGHPLPPHVHHDHLSDLLLLSNLEIDNFHARFFFPSMLFHRLLDNGVEGSQLSGKPLRLNLGYGTVFVHSSGLVVSHLDSSSFIYLAQLEGLLAYFKQISGHSGPLDMVIDGEEYTINFSVDDQLAKNIIEATGVSSFYLTNQPVTLKVYRKDKEKMRAEINHPSEMIKMLKQVSSGKISPPEMNIYLPETSSSSGEVGVLQQQVVMLENKLDASNEKLDQMMSFVNTIIKNQSSLSSLTLEMDTRLEQNQERILGQIQQTYIQNTEILQKLYKENTSFFV